MQFIKERETGSSDAPEGFFFFLGKVGKRKGEVLAHSLDVSPLFFLSFVDWSKNIVEIINPVS